MSDESATARCQRCGAEYDATVSPLGLCPACLLTLGMSSPAMTPVQETRNEEAPAPAAAVRRFTLPIRRVLIVAAVALAIVAGILFLRRAREPIVAHSSPVRFTLRLPDGVEMLDGAQFGVSADGTQLVVAARTEDGRQRLWLRRFQSVDWRELPQTEGATLPFWSPSGDHVGFFTSRSLKRIDTSTELMHTVCDAPSARGGSWSSQGIIVFAGANGLMRVPASGGSPEPVTELDFGRGEVAHLWPQVLPDGRHLLFVALTAKNTTTAHVRDMNTSRTVSLADIPGAVAAISDVVLFSRGGTLAAQPYDLSRGQPAGSAHSIGGTDGVAASPITGAGFSASGTVLVYRRHEPRSHQLTWFDRTGRVIGAVGPPSDYEGFSLSPDGRRVAAGRRSVGNDAANIWLMDIDSERISRLTSGPAHAAFPIWSPEGARIAFISRRDDNEAMFTVDTNGGGKESVLFQSPEPKRLTDWSRDGRVVIYTAQSARTGTDVWTVGAAENQKPQPLDLSAANDSQAALSPDGRWIAYVSDETGREEIYVRPFPPADGRWLISTGGGVRPQWSGHGRELFYISPDDRLMSVAVAPVPSQYRPAQTLFHVHRALDFAVSPDGQRFLVQVPVHERRDNELHVVLNWASQLPRK